MKQKNYILIRDIDKQYPNFAFVGTTAMLLDINYLKFSLIINDDAKLVNLCNVLVLHGSCMYYLKASKTVCDL